jgi:hypothetical protein
MLQHVVYIATTVLETKPIQPCIKSDKQCIITQANWIGERKGLLHYTQRAELNHHIWMNSQLPQTKFKETASLKSPANSVRLIYESWRPKDDNLYDRTRETGHNKHVQPKVFWDYDTVESGTHTDVSQNLLNQATGVSMDKSLRNLGKGQDEVTGERWRLHNEELMICAPQQLLFVWSRMRWEGHVARMGGRSRAYRVFVGRPEGKETIWKN